MDWLERLPTWVKAFATIGGVLLTAFAHRLPKGYQTLGLCAGLAVLLVAGLGFVLHVMKEWRGGTAVEPFDVTVLGLGGVAFFSLVALGGLIWQHIQSSTVMPVITHQSNISAASDPPAGPRSGPIGPIFAVELVQLFMQAPKPCVANVTAPEDNKNLRDTLIWILRYSAQCDIQIDSSPKNIDDPLVTVTTEPGLVIHYISPLEKKLPISLRLVALKWQLYQVSE